MRRNLVAESRPSRTGRWTFFAMVAAALGALSMALAASAPISVEEYVHEFESHYSDVRTLQADFTQTYQALGRTREESGIVYLARGGRMRWVYQKPEEKLFVSNGRQILFYVPAEKQLTVSSMHEGGEAQMPLDLLLSRLQLSKIFSRVEFADQALDQVERGDRVIRGYPRFIYKRDYRSVLVELTPSFDVRRLVVFYPDNSTMQFAFSRIERNKPIDSSFFVFSPPPGTEVIHQ